MSMSSIHHISLPTDAYLLARKKKKIFSSTRRGHTGYTQREQTLCSQLILFVSPV